MQPNDGFEQQLREFEAIYRARVEVFIKVCPWLKKQTIKCKQVEPREGSGHLSKRGREEEDADEENEGVKSRVIDNRCDSMET